MSGGILFIIVRALREEQVTNLVRELAVPGALASIRILTDAAGPRRDQAATADLIGQISAYPQHDDNQLLIDREAHCAIAELIRWWQDRDFGKSPPKSLAPKAMVREIRDHLRERRLEWRTHALAEISKFEGPHTSLDAWLQQFGELRCGPIGQKIAGLLQVMKARDLPGRPFDLRAPDEIGQRQLRCYVQDSDQGGSWVDMQAILTHAYPPETVFPVRWDAGSGQLIFPDQPADTFVIYEDGLWSGKEAVERVRAIAAAPPPAPVVFRFGVVTDFGLSVVRQAIRSLGLGGRVSIDTASPDYIRFLNDGLPPSLRLGLDQEPRAYYAALHEHVEPHAFRAPTEWSDEQIGLCREIGRQLVRQWLSMRPDKPPPTPEEIDRFALGGGGFASTMLFARSVPKVCLPLLWLDGPVQIEGRRISWRPLFIDARRISGSGLLHAGGTGPLA